ncbi:hypothetical protein C2E23DRAFT_824233 [Lenzites betulinus]|nr:hypothetical protein C2E23DRAFT_824233 [Lenzites betulinus]
MTRRCSTNVSQEPRASETGEAPDASHHSFTGETSDAMRQHPSSHLAGLSPRAPSSSFTTRTSSQHAGPLSVDAGPSGLSLSVIWVSR